MTLREVFSSIANAIRSKTGKTDTIKPVDMATEIENIQTGGDNKLAQLVEGTLTTVTADDLAGVTEVRQYAFYYSDLTNITLPDNLTKIGSNAFTFCTLLTSINIPDSVTSIGTSALQYCTELTQITIPDSVTSIGSRALDIGASTNKATVTMKPTTPPTISSSTFTTSKLNKIIVPVGCGDTYKSATNWSNFADYIEEATV